MKEDNGLDVSAVVRAEDDGEYHKRDSWEIREDVRAIQRTIAILKSKPRWEEVQKHIKKELKEKKEEESSMEALADGDLKEALGLK